MVNCSMEKTMKGFFDRETLDILGLVLLLTAVYLAIVLVGFKQFLRFSKKEQSRRIRPEDAEAVRKEIELDPFGKT